MKRPTEKIALPAGTGDWFKINPDQTGFYRVLYEPATQKYGIGQSLYYQLPLFCNPDEYIFEWCYEMIQDYHLVNHYNIPMSDSLENVDAFRLDCFTVIEDEANKIRIFKAKDGS